MDALLALQSSLHCLAVFCSAIADWDKASSPTTAAHTAKVGFITHISGKFRRTATARGRGAGAKELPRWQPQYGPQPLTGSIPLFAIRSRIVKNKERTASRKKGGALGRRRRVPIAAGRCPRRQCAVS